MEDLTRLLTSADAGSVVVTFVLCQLSKLALPTDPENPGRWTVAPRFTWIPFVLAFTVAMLLAMILYPEQDAVITMKFRTGLQTGAYAVVVWETWSNGKKLFGAGAGG